MAIFRSDDRLVDKVRMTHKHILLYSEDFPPYTGGIAQWTMGIAISCKNLGHRIEIFTRYRDEHHVAAHQEYGLEIRYIRGDNWKKLRTFYCKKSITDRLKESNTPDLIIGTTWNVTRGILRSAKKYSIPVITVVHGLEVTRSMNFLKRRWLRWTLKNSFKIVAVSRFTKEYITDCLAIPPEDVIVLPNGVDTQRFYPIENTDSLRHKLGISGEKVILTLARVIPRKGHEYVIKSLPQVLKSIPSVKYVIAGEYEPAYKAELDNLIRELNLVENVHFTGYVEPDEMVMYYNLCDVYAMPSRTIKEKGDTEGFGITFLEANACLKPVIGGNEGGVVDAIIDGETGYLVDPVNTEEIAEKVIRLLSDQKLARYLGYNGRARIERAYTWEILSGKLLHQLYDVKKGN
jgi:phosphatidyl-myo-inositol dimannoside synthase